MIKNKLQQFLMVACSAGFLIVFSACNKEIAPTPADDVAEIQQLSPTGISGRLGDDEPGGSAPVMLIIDEESIDNGNAPNYFSNIAVNDQIASIGLRQTLKYFLDNVGDTIDLFTGQVGDEGWFAPKTIPSSWIGTGPTDNGTRNYLMAGPGLGSGNDREIYLDKIPKVTPLRATGLKMLIGRTVIAVVYDSDVSINYSPLDGSLKGENLGVVAFDVIDVQPRIGASSSSLPWVKIMIRDVTEVSSDVIHIFQNAPAPQSSSMPFDITPPGSVPEANFVPAP